MNADGDFMPVQQDLWSNRNQDSPLLIFLACAEATNKAVTRNLSVFQFKTNEHNSRIASWHTQLLLYSRSNKHMLGKLMPITHHRASIPLIIPNMCLKCLS